MVFDYVFKGYTARKLAGKQAVVDENRKLLFLVKTGKTCRNIWTKLISEDLFIAIHFEVNEI